MSFPIEHDSIHILENQIAIIGAIFQFIIGIQIEFPCFAIIGDLKEEFIRCGSGQDGLMIFEDFGLPDDENIMAIDGDGFSIVGITIGDPIPDDFFGKKDEIMRSH